MEDESKKGKRRREREELGYASAHVLIESGVIPGITTNCRCEQCRLVAKSMAEAGYLDDMCDRWWDT